MIYYHEKLGWSFTRHFSENKWWSSACRLFLDSLPNSSIDSHDIIFKILFTMPLRIRWRFLAPLFSMEIQKIPYFHRQPYYHPQCSHYFKNYFDFRFVNLRKLYLLHLISLHLLATFFPTLSLTLRTYSDLQWNTSPIEYRRNCQNAGKTVVYGNCLQEKGIWTLPSMVWRLKNFWLLKNKVREKRKEGYRLIGS